MKVYSIVWAYTLLNVLFCVAICGDTEHGINYNKPNPNLAGLSKDGQNVEKRLYDQVVNKELPWHNVGTTRTNILRHEMLMAQGARNNSKRNELQLRKELDKKGRDLNSVMSRLRTKIHPTSSEYRLKHFVNRKEEKKDIIRKIVSDAAIHKAHGNFNEADVTRVVKYPWYDSHALGYDHDARITSAPGYKSRSPSPPTPSRSQPASSSRSS